MASSLVVNGGNSRCDVLWQIKFAGACRYRRQFWPVPTVTNRAVSFCISSRHVVCCVTIPWSSQLMVKSSRWLESSWLRLRRKRLTSGNREVPSWSTTIPLCCAGSSRSSKAWPVDSVPSTTAGKNSSKNTSWSGPTGCPSSRPRRPRTYTTGANIRVSRSVANVGSWRPGSCCPPSGPGRPCPWTPLESANVASTWCRNQTTSRCLSESLLKQTCVSF